MCAKKGMGATKVQTNFDDLEREAEMADSLRSQKAAEANKPEEIEAQVRRKLLSITFSSSVKFINFSIRRVRFDWLIKT